MKSLLRLVFKYSNLFIAAVILVTAFFVWQSAQVVIDPNTDSLFPEDKARAEYLLNEFGVEESAQQVLFLGVKSSDTMTIEKLQAFSKVLDELSAFPEIDSILSPFNFPVFDKQGAKFLVTTSGPAGAPPSTEDELETFKRRLLNDPYATGSVVAENGEVICALLNNENITYPDEFMERFAAAISVLDDDFDDVFYSGEIPIAQRTTSYIASDIVTLIILIVVVMVVIFYLSFGTLRGVILPLLVVAAGGVWSIGFMTLMGWKLTIVSVTIPPLVLAIGSSYSIHILNEYYRNASLGNENSDWLFDSVLHVNKTVLLAALTTIVGFVSLMTSSILPVKQFSVSVIVGIITCALMSLFLLPAVLSKLSFPAVKHIDKIRSGFFSSLMDRMGPFIYRKVVIFGGILAALFVVFMISKGSITNQADYLEYFPADDPVIQHNAKILEYTGGAQALNITLKAPEGEEKYFLRPDVLAAVSDLEIQLAEINNVQKVVSFSTMLKNGGRVMFGKYEIPKSTGLIMLLSRYMKLVSGTGLDAEMISEDYNTMTIFLRVYDQEHMKFITETDIRALNEKVIGLTAQHIPDDVDSITWGDTVLFLSTSQIMNKEQTFSTVLSLFMVFIITAIIFRSFKFGIVSLVPLLTGIMCYYITMALFGIPMDMTTMLVTNIAIGVGVDDSIHFLLQFRRQMKKTEGNLSDAFSTTFSITGRPIVLTTLSIVAGLMVLCFASFKPLVYFGLLVSVSLLAAMIGTLVFLPVFIRLVHIKR